MKRKRRTVSRRNYAAMRGVSAQAIDQAVRRGVIQLGKDGRIDPGEADAIWFRRHQQRETLRHDGAEAEARREQAALTQAVAQVRLARHKVEQLRAKLVDRDKGQAAIGALVGELQAALPTLGAESDLAGELVATIAADLGDVVAESLKVTQRD